MKTTIKLLAVIALVLTPFAHPSNASAGGKYRFKGDTADAYYFSFDGCVYTDVYVFTTEGKIQSPPGPAGTSSWTDLWISQYDACTDTQLLSAGGGSSLADPDFQVFGKLDAARLNATVSVYDWVSDSNFDVHVDLTWAGYGPTSRQSSNSHYHFPGCKIHSQSRGTFRSADVSGSVSDGTTNYTPNPMGGSLSSVRSGDLVIGCN